VDVVGIGGGSLLVLILMIEAPIPFILIAGLLNIIQFSTCYSGYKMHYLISKWRHTLFNKNYVVLNDWILELDTFERRRGNTTTWYTTTWYQLHLILYAGNDCHHIMSVEAH
jgi:hypothetical protein